MADGSKALFNHVSLFYIKKLKSGEADAANVFNDMLDVFARLLATQPNATHRQKLVEHVGVVLPEMVKKYVDAEVAQADFGKVAPKADPKPTILKPTDREKRFVERAKGDLK